MSMRACVCVSRSSESPAKKAKSSGGGGGSSGWRLLRNQDDDPDLRVDAEKGAVTRVQPRPASNDDSASTGTRSRRKMLAGDLDDSAIMKHISVARTTVCNSVRALMVRDGEEEDQLPCEGCSSTKRPNACIVMPCGRKIRLCCQPRTLCSLRGQARKETSTRIKRSSVCTHTQPCAHA